MSQVHILAEALICVSLSTDGWFFLLSLQESMRGEAERWGEGRINKYFEGCLSMKNMFPKNK